MSGLLLVDATEEVQSLAEALERAGFSIDACPLAEAAERLAGDPEVDAILISLLDGPADTAVRRLLRADSVPSQIASIAVLRPEQLAEFDPEFLFDDFLVSTEIPEELVARVRRAIRRRAGSESSHVIHCGDLTIDQAAYKVFVAGRPVELTYREYELLRFLALNHDKVCTREMLLSQVWGFDFYGGGRTVDVHIRRLRSKIEDSAHNFIETVRNVGYRIRVD